MQFETTKKVGNPTKKVSFPFIYRLKPRAMFSLIDIFYKMGGIKLDSFTEWDFPNYISNETIAQIIKNTCFECGGLMKDSTAFDNTWVSSDDFGGDAGQIGTTMSKSGTAKQIKVRKCTQCGHSHT